MDVVRQVLEVTCESRMGTTSSRPLAWAARRAHRSSMSSLVDRYHNEIAGVLSCWDRVIVRGRTLLPPMLIANG